MAFTSNTVFQSPLYGYNFSFTAVGLTSLSPLVGSMILFYVGGAGTDRFMIWQAHRNGGIMEPESRIYAALVAGPIMSAGLVLYGSWRGVYGHDHGAQHHRLRHDLCH
ncbi:hypothetical protein Neosp_007935 [[Neocosmospora] mangrovei]